MAFANLSRASHAINIQAHPLPLAVEFEECAKKANILSCYGKKLSQFSSPDARNAFLDEIYRAAAHPEETPESGSFKKSASQLYEAFQWEAYKATGMHTKATLAGVVKSGAVIPLMCVPAVLVCGVFAKPGSLKIASGIMIFLTSLAYLLAIRMAVYSKMSHGVFDRFVAVTSQHLFENSFKTMLAETFPLALKSERKSVFIEKARDGIAFKEAMLSVLSDCSKGRSNLSLGEQIAYRSDLEEMRGKKASGILDAFTLYAREVAVQSPLRMTFGQMLREAFPKANVA